MTKKGNRKVRMQSLTDNANAFDPSQFDDPVAMQTNWTPAEEKCGSSFQTHKLIVDNPKRLELRASILNKAFSLILLIIGLGLLPFGVGSLVWFFYFYSSTNVFALIPMLGSLVFTIAGVCMLYFSCAPIVFDKEKGLFYKGRKTPENVFDKSTLKKFAQLERIYALQLISEYFGPIERGDKGFHSYELNLVLENGERINVVDHGKLDNIREVANNLSVFLGKPIWDAIGIDY